MDKIYEGVDGNIQYVRDACEYFFPTVTCKFLLPQKNYAERFPEGETSLRLRQHIEYPLVMTSTADQMQ